MRVFLKLKKVANQYEFAFGLKVTNHPHHNEYYLDPSQSYTYTIDKDTVRINVTKTPPKPAPAPAPKPVANTTKPVNKPETKPIDKPKNPENTNNDISDIKNELLTADIEELNQLRLITKNKMILYIALAVLGGAALTGIPMATWLILKKQKNKVKDKQEN